MYVYSLAYKYLFNLWSASILKKKLKVIDGYTFDGLRKMSFLKVSNFKRSTNGSCDIRNHTISVLLLNIISLNNIQVAKYLV